MADVEVSPGGTHWAKGPGGDYIYFLGGFCGALLLRNINYLLSGNDHRLTFLDFIVDFGNSFHFICSFL
jgi:hypothetical protein